MKASKISKKEVKAKIQTSLFDVALSFNVEKPSKKTLKILEKTAAALAASLKDDHRKQSKKTNAELNADKPKQKHKPVLAV
jgi:hypothetical protein